MLIENTLSKLQEMKLTMMAKAFREQLTDTNISSLPFEDRFGLLVDQEWTSRKNNHLKRLIKQAKFSDTGACVEDIEYHACLLYTSLARGKVNCKPLPYLRLVFFALLK